LLLWTKTIGFEYVNLKGEKTVTNPVIQTLKEPKDLLQITEHVNTDLCLEHRRL